LVWLDELDGRKNVIKVLARARNLGLADFNHDGKLDIVAIFALTHKEIVVFYNKGNGQFFEKQF
jgi:hypothetical protein